MFGLQHAAFGADADERDRSVENDLRRSQVHNLARSRAGFHHGINRVACFLVQFVELARRKNDIADEFDRERRALPVATAFDARSSEHIVEPKLQSLVHGADHAADMADVLVRGSCADAVGQNTIFPPVGIGQRIVAGQLMQRLVALLLDQDFDRALLRVSMSS